MWLIFLKNSARKNELLLENGAPSLTVDGYY